MAFYQRRNVWQQGMFGLLNKSTGQRGGPGHKVRTQKLGRESHSHEIEPVVQGPEVRRPVGVRQASFEREQPGKDVKELALQDKGPEREPKACHNYQPELDQICQGEVLDRVVLFGLVLTDEAVACEEVDEVGWRAVHEDVLQVQQDDKVDGAHEAVVRQHGPDGREQDAEQEPVVLEVDVVDQEEAGVGQDQQGPQDRRLSCRTAPTK